MMLKEAAMGDKEYTAMLEARIRNLTKSEIKNSHKRIHAWQ